MAKKSRRPLARLLNPRVTLRAQTIPDRKKEASRHACELPDWRPLIDDEVDEDHQILTT